VAVQHIRCDETKYIIKMTPRSTDGSGWMKVQIKSALSGFGANT